MATFDLTSKIFRRLRVICKQHMNHISQRYDDKLYVITARWTSSSQCTSESENMKSLLKARFPLAESIDVIDISGGCGDMYAISIESVEFKGLTMVKQHRLVNEVLKEKIKNMHGLRIHTAVPAGSTK